MRRTADLLGYRCDGCLAGQVISFVIQHHAHRTLAHLRGKLVGCLAQNRPFLKEVRASDNPGRFSLTEFLEFRATNFIDGWMRFEGTIQILIRY
jgi:hypothetical protein